MLLELVSGQEGKFDAFADFLQEDFPKFVRSNPSVSRAMERYGMFLAFEPGADPTEREKALRVTLDPGKRQRIMLRSLVWGLPPDILIMSGRFADFAGFFNPRGKKIVVDKDLVLLWQDDPEHPNISRLIRAVLVHELVHYYNDLVLPGTTIYEKAEGHFERFFSAEAFSPLGWKKIDYIPDKTILDLWRSQMEDRPGQPK
jgi:hypothetical protein